MKQYKRALWLRALCAVVLSGLALAEAPPATIRHIRLRGNSVEITASAPVTPQAQILANPDRLVLDFPNAVAAADLHTPVVHGREIKAIRVALFSPDPPVTRVVLDLASPQPFEIIPVTHSVIVKLGGAQQKLAAFKTEFEVVDSPPPVVPPPPPQPILDVQFENGVLRVHAERVTLTQVLNEIQRKTGAEINVPPGAQDKVIVSLGPGPARDVLAALLNGSPFNFVMIGSDSDPSQLRSVILSPKSQGASPPQ